MSDLKVGDRVQLEDFLANESEGKYANKIGGKDVVGTVYHVLPNGKYGKYSDLNIISVKWDTGVVHDQYYYQRGLKIAVRHPPTLEIEYE